MSGYLGEAHSSWTQGGRGTVKGDKVGEDTVRKGPDPEGPVTVRTVLTWENAAAAGALTGIRWWDDTGLDQRRTKAAVRNDRALFWRYSLVYSERERAVKSDSKVFGLRHWEILSCHLLRQGRLQGEQILKKYSSVLWKVNFGNSQPIYGISGMRLAEMA